ncbi:MAG: DUF2974 domain-containing protein [Clostridia bacterium]|nr:DUF2974 domain-containing protein [Clostridia bacterium]
MENVFDYIKWRGDLSFSSVRPCEVDGVIFSMMSYLDYGLLCGGAEKTLRAAAAGYCSDGDYERVNLGLIMPSKEINRMFCLAAQTKRFGNAVISDFDARTDDDAGYQFGALTYHLPGKQMMIVFRGTDDSLAGWREDCCLSFLDEIPAQKMAVEYVCRLAEKYPEERIYLSGHSKGGNLALYAAVKSAPEIQERIVRAYCYDGPGLSYSMVRSESFRKMQRKLTVLIPQSSYIGIMFEKGEKYTVIRSEGRALLQHDPYSWELEGPSFVRLPELSKWGKKNEEQFRAGMAKMTSEEKREFVETFFGIIEATGARTLSELSSDAPKKLIAAVKSYKDLDKQKKEMMLTLILRLLDLKRL